MNFDIFYGDTFIPEMPKMLNKNFSVVQKGMDVFYDASTGVLLKPLTTTGKVQGANGQFVTMVVDNLVVKNQFTNLYDNNTSADYNFYKTFISANFIPRDPCTAATNWPYEASTYKFIDVNQPYYKIDNQNTIVLNNNNLSQVVGIIFPHLDASYGTAPFRIVQNPSTNSGIPSFFQIDSSIAPDASTYFYMEFIMTAFDPSWGPTWSQYKYGASATGGSGGGGGGGGTGFVGPGTPPHLAMFVSGNQVQDSSVYMVGSTLTTFDLNADGSISQNGHEVTRFLPNVDPGLTMGSTIGGLPAGTPASSLLGKTYEDILNAMLFPLVAPYIPTMNSLSFTGFAPQTVEVGSVVPSPANVLASFNPGLIKNGNNSNGPNLVGDPILYTFRRPGGIIDGTVPGPTYSANWTYTTINASLGANVWNSSVTYNAGSGTYYDNKGNPSTNLDASRIAGTSFANSATITGLYYAWRYLGNQSTSPSTSSGVRALLIKSFLSVANTGAFSISIPAFTQEVSFYVPAGKIIKVNFVESANADVTRSFIMTPMTVNDAAGSPVNYEKWTSFIGLGGYPSIATYNISIT
jgi:hypothetical protein